MNRIDYNFSSYQKEFNETAYKILRESFKEEFDAEQISNKIDEAEITYNKIQKILNCPEMIKSHAYLYTLDMENVDENNKIKVDKLYELGKARGVIQDEEPENDESDETTSDCDDWNICGGPEDALTNQELTPGTQTKVMSSASYTILYSAMKCGKIKTGEFFSTAQNIEDAKTDCISNLSNLGYNSIRILGIEYTNNAIDDYECNNLTEDDSKEYEEQETGSKDTDVDEIEDKTKISKEDDMDDTTSDEEEKSGKETEEKLDSKDTKDEVKGDSEKEDEEKDEEKEEDEDKKELSPSEKQILRDEYISLFKTMLLRTKLEKSVDDMTIKEKADFWSTLSEKWNKADPEEFMTDKDIEKLNSMVIKK